MGNKTKEVIIEAIEELAPGKYSSNSLKKSSLKSLDEKLTKIVERREMEKPKYIIPVDPKHIILNKDAKIWMSKKFSAKKAKPEIKEVKAQKEVLDSEGNVIKEAVKAVKYRPAVKASPALLKFHAIGNTPEICNQLIARLYDQGFIPEYDGQLEEIDEVKFCAIYLVPERLNEKFRKCFRLCKIPGKYNDESEIKAAANEEKEAKKVEREAKKEAERLKKEAEKAKAKEEKELAKKKKAAEEKEAKKKMVEGAKKAEAKSEAKPTDAKPADAKPTDAKPVAAKPEVKDKAFDEV